MLPAEAEVRIDSSVVLFALGVAMLTGLLFGLAPAIQAGGTRLVGAIKDGGRGTTPGSVGRRLRSGLVVAEVALAFVLLVGAGLMMRSLLGLLDSDPGFESGNVLTARLPIAQASFDDPAELNAYLDSLQSTVGALPGVRETAIASALPLRGWGYGMPYFVQGRERPEPGDQGGGFFKMVTPSYFGTLGLRIVEGRALDDTDRAGAPPVAVINETLARREFPDGSALGQRLLVQQIVPGRQQLGDEIAWEIVGVVADEKIGSLRDVESGGLYVTTSQSPVYGVSMLVHADIDPAGLERSVRAAVSRVNANQAISDVETLEQIVAESVRTERIQSVLLATFAATALLLAGIGIYGVISYSVAQRTHELGIRATLGATSDNLKMLIFRGGMRLTLAGLAIGLIGSLAAGRLMSTWLFGVGAIDPVTTGAVALILLAVAALACLIPAHRATRIDPNEALRSS
jgi:putative ABC transport system permease protein